MQNALKLYINEQLNFIPINFFHFSGGEEHVRIDTRMIDEIYHIRIDAKIMSSQIMMQLLLLNDALNRTQKLTENVIKILSLSYMPGARQDRVCEPGEALSVAVYADLINSIKANKVIIHDPHSDVTPALINNILVISQDEIVCEKLGEYLKKEQITLVSPDAGALKKIYKTAKKLELPVLEASKKRDTKTGQIISSSIETHPNYPEKVMIIDDICDGGRTFIELAKVLKLNGVKSIWLYVTHGIFSQGLSVFDDYIESIFTFNLLNAQLTNTE
ncbi:ribose-phosphate diphosphokinase [Thorsellia anophelis]|uniref:Ribose-phosphate pyrophosphokinase n=1 Tax=Thorsellia anophelis DSM 18579 TaxID=1123402 RepID=A0A1I0F9G6_9GAMM|nr:ribose-phosphate diphosphokinase [Thorsellia anophelis]SET54651.1 ribose-phosphate pyrophosphokinase [Thorsellia anophelis DSM 18579]